METHLVKQSQIWVKFTKVHVHWMSGLTTLAFRDWTSSIGSAIYFVTAFSIDNPPPWQPNFAPLLLTVIPYRGNFPC